MRNDHLASLPSAEVAPHSPQRLLLRIVDAGIAATLFLAPLLMGGRHPVGKLVFISCVGITAITWCLRQSMVRDARWIRSGAELLLLAGLLLMILQIAPVPTSLLLATSPKLGELLPLWMSDGEEVARVGEWSQASLTPHATREALAMFVAYAMLFLVTVQRMQTVRDIHRVLRWLAFAAVAMAVLGLAQFLFGNGRFLWIYEDPFRDTTNVVKGPFFNENHFAHFLTLGIGPLTWWWWHSHRATRRTRPRSVSGFTQSDNEVARLAPLLTVFLPIGLGLVVFAGLLTFSRGGVVAMLTASTISIAVLASLGMLAKQMSAMIFTKIVLLAGALFIFGYEPLVKELQSLEQSSSLEELSRGRHVLWEAHTKIIRDFALTGTGVGSHRQIYPTYMDEHFDVTFTYGESGFMQVLVEAGVPGLLLVLAGIALALAWCARVLRASTRTIVRAGDSERVSNRDASETLELKACVAALLGGIVASVVHSVFDFVWYIPACMTLTVITLACACRAAQLSCGRDGRVGEAPSVHPTSPTGTINTRLRWLAATGVALASSILMIQVRLPAALAAAHWTDYIRAAQIAKKAPGDQELQENYESRIGMLGAALRHDPDHAEAHLELASLCLLQFEVEQRESPNPMPLGQIGEAVVASHFPSPVARDQWLAVAVGRNLELAKQAHEHASRAIQLCPLQGEAYVFLNELEFLGDTNTRVGNAFVEQALRVRPHSGPVLLAAGAKAALAGDLTAAIQLWKQAFRIDRQTQTKIIEMLGPHAPATDFIEQFSPDIDGLSSLYAYYREHDQDTDARNVAMKYVELLQRRAEQTVGEAAARSWREASTINAFLGNGAEALRCIRQAVAAKPADLIMHEMLARQLLAEEHLDGAIEEIQSCLRREPNNASLRTLLSEAHRLRLAKAGDSRQPR